MAGSLGDGEIYTVEDAAPFLGMTPNGVRSAVHRGELYSVPMRDGRMYWRLKRALPARFTAIVDRVARSGLLK